VIVPNLIQGADMHRTTARRPLIPMLWVLVIAGSLAASTAPGSSDFAFVVIGDTRPNKSAKSDFSPFCAQLDQISKYRPALVINVGDLIYGYGGAATDAAWTKYDSIIDASKLTYHQIPGNHDVFSKKAEVEYGKLFHSLYYSFDYQNCHFVMLDNAEKAVWGNITDAQLTWLKKDLSANKKPMVFVFMHLPAWVENKIDRKYYVFWRDTLHPLFRASRVAAVFGGHIHTFGPTQTFDGIPYYITGGGGAELDKWYKDHGGNFHFMLVNVSGKTIHPSVVFDDAVLTVEQADVERNHSFARQMVDNIVLPFERMLRPKEEISVTVRNPLNRELSGRAQWEFPDKAFRLSPDKIDVRLAPHASQTYSFEVRVSDTLNHPFPQLRFKLHSADTQIAFSKDLVVRRTVQIPRTIRSPTIDGVLDEWSANSPLLLFGSDAHNAVARVMMSFDENALYVAADVNDADHVGNNRGNMIFLNDAFVLGIDRSAKRLSHGNDDVQLEFSSTDSGIVVYDRANGREVDIVKAGMSVAIKPGPARRLCYEIAIPSAFVAPLRLSSGTTFGINFAVSDARSSGERTLAEWAPGLGYDGMDETFQSQLHFSEAKLR